MRTSSLLDRAQKRATRIMARARAVRDDVDDARRNVEAIAARLGLPRQDEQPAIDVGRRPDLVRNAARGLLALLAAALLGGALLLIGVVVIQLVVAFVIVTRGLGLRIDLNPLRGAARA